MIRTEALTKRYRSCEALAGVSLEVPPSSVFALVGPNGAGKSTLIKILLNLARPSSGRAKVLDTDSTRLGARQLAQIGYVSEEQKLPGWMRIDYFVKYVKAFYPAWDDALAADLVRQYGLPARRRLRELSRGARVKAALAVSLAYRPKLLLLDEPFGGLDVLVREQLIESIVDCTPEATIFLASHDLAEIESFATHIAYLNEGQLEFVEEMPNLAARFREVEITLESPEPLPEPLPQGWLNAEQSGPVVRFTDNHYEESRSRDEVRRLFHAVRSVSAREMSLRSIVLALAKSRRATCA
jgi:ABC-2 type transport system ATP-binding protein